MDFPILVDALNELGVWLVPIHVFIDEAGTVRRVGARAAELEAFLAEPPVAHDAPVMPTVDPPDGAIESLTESADRLFRFGGDADLDRVIDAYVQSLKAPETLSALSAAELQFRLGVAYRRRFESTRAQRGDFGRAIEHWSAALAGNPNQYIWRRRIQQFGPRLDKPYNFYDWVDEARAAITARGETPWPLRVEPRGAELTSPQRTFTQSSADVAEPDPAGQIIRDTQALIDARVVVTPSTDARQRAYRVHVVLQPNAAGDAAWNNSGDATELWVTPPAGWEISSRYGRVPLPREEISGERRTIEFELRAPAEASGEITIPAYALYGACVGESGMCLYLRQDLSIKITIGE